MNHLFINECRIQRYTQGAKDGYGNPAKAWAAHLTVDGRISYPKGRQIFRDTEMVNVDAVLFLEDIDVIEHDRVYVDDVLYEILFVAQVQDLIGSHHKELTLKRFEL